MRNKKNSVQLNIISILSILVITILTIVYPEKASASVFYDYKDLFFRYTLSAPYTYRFPDAYFVVNLGNDELIHKKLMLRPYSNSSTFLILDIVIDGANKKIYLTDKHWENHIFHYATNRRDYAIAHIYPSSVPSYPSSTTLFSTSVTPKQPYGSSGSIYGDNVNVSDITIDLEGYEEGKLYVLRIRTYGYEQYDNPSNRIIDWLIPFEIINDGDFSIHPSHQYAYPGETVNITVSYPNPDPTSTIIARVYPSPLEFEARADKDYDDNIIISQNSQWQPTPASSDDGIEVEKGQQDYKISFNIPPDAPDGSIYTVEIQALYANFVVHRAFSQVIVGSPQPALPPPELNLICPFILNSPWAIAGQSVTVGCYDNPLDTYTITGGKVWIPNGSTALLTNQGNGTFTASLVAPSTEGFVPVVYEVGVQDASGRNFKVSGSQNMIVTSSPSAMYCPPPADGVVSTPGSEERVGVRLFR